MSVWLSLNWLTRLLTTSPFVPPSACQKVSFVALAFLATFAVAAGRVAGAGTPVAGAAAAGVAPPAAADGAVVAAPAAGAVVAAPAAGAVVPAAPAVAAFVAAGAVVAVALLPPHALRIAANAPVAAVPTPKRSRFRRESRFFCVIPSTSVLLRFRGLSTIRPPLPLDGAGGESPNQLALPDDE